MAIEDAAALGILFDKRYFNGDISQALAVYEEVRLPRATRVQAAAAKAAYNINERIGELPPSLQGVVQYADDV
jgi:salicylate hydroxylase